MTNNRISPARQYEAKRDPDHPKICARCNKVWREYEPEKEPHCHCFDHEYEDERREMERIASWKRYMEDANEQSKAKQRIADLERLVKDARPMVCSSRYVMVADNWLTRYDEMFPEVQ